MSELEEVLLKEGSLHPSATRSSRRPLRRSSEAEGRNGEERKQEKEEGEEEEEEEEEAPSTKLNADRTAIDVSMAKQGHTRRFNMVENVLVLLSCDFSEARVRRPPIRAHILAPTPMTLSLWSLCRSGRSLQVVREDLDPQGLSPHQVSRSPDTDLQHSDTGQETPVTSGDGKSSQSPPLSSPDVAEALTQPTKRSRDERRSSLLRHGDWFHVSEEESKRLSLLLEGVSLTDRVSMTHQPERMPLPPLSDFSTKVHPYFKSSWLFEPHEAGRCVAQSFTLITLLIVRCPSQTLFPRLQIQRDANSCRKSTEGSGRSLG